MRLLRSKTGQIQTEAQWRAEVDRFWEYAASQNTNSNKWIKPIDAFERYIKILQLEEIKTISWEGVFCP